MRCAQVDLTYLRILPYTMIERLSDWELTMVYYDLSQEWLQTLRSQ